MGRAFALVGLNSDGGTAAPVRSLVGLPRNLSMCFAACARCWASGWREPRSRRRCGVRNFRAVGLVDPPRWPGRTEAHQWYGTTTRARQPGRRGGLARISPSCGGCKQLLRLRSKGLIVAQVGRPALLQRTGAWKSGTSVLDGQPQSYFVLNAQSRQVEVAGR